MASHMEGEVLVQIDGVRENTNVFDENAFLREEEATKRQLGLFLATGARVENLCELVAQVVVEELG
jgi:hypothetical protein